MSTLFQLHKEGKQVTFVWTPSHCGIQGNEAADKATRRAANTNVVEYSPIRLSDAKHFAENVVKDQWFIDWRRLTKKLSSIKGKPDK